MCVLSIHLATSSWIICISACGQACVCVSTILCKWDSNILCLLHKQFPAHTLSHPYAPPTSIYSLFLYIAPFRSIYKITSIAYYEEEPLLLQLQLNCAGKLVNFIQLTGIALCRVFPPVSLGLISLYVFFARFLWNSNTY